MMHTLAVLFYAIAIVAFIAWALEQGSDDD